MNALLFAIQFLTRLPVIVKADPTPESLGRSVLYYPAVGLLIGGLLWGLAQLLSVVEPMISAALLLTFWVGITGGLHLDGLADCADGWIGGQGNQEKSLEIMKDPNAGSMAVIALFLILLMKFVALVVLLEHDAGLVLVLAPIIGRSFIPALMLTTPYIRKKGLGSVIVSNLPRSQAKWLIALVLMATLVLAGFVLTISVVAGFFALRVLFMRTFGGVTGDVYGAFVELGELIVLFVAVCLLS